MIKDIPTKDLANCIGSTAGFASQIKNEWRKLPAKYCISVSKRFGIPLHDLRPDIYPDPNHDDQSTEMVTPPVNESSMQRRATDSN